MKKALLGVAVVLAGAFLSIHLLRLDVQPEGSAEGAATLDAASRSQVTRFWSAFQRATRLRTQGDFATAAEAYREALELDPAHQESLYYLGNCLMETGNYVAARGMYERLVELQPDSARGLSGLGILLSSPFPGNPLDLDRARAAFEQVTRINPEQSGPFLRLGDLALQQGRLPQALAHFRTAAGFRSPEGIYLAGMVLYRMGRLEEARSQFQTVLEIVEHEGRIAGRGASSEGDLKPSGSTPRSPLQRAALKSRILLAWSEGSPVQAAAGEETPPSRQPAVLRKRVRSLIPARAGSGDTNRWQVFGGRESLDRLARPSPPVLPAGVEVASPVATTLADFDGDGLEDLYVTSWTTAGSLWRNLGGGRFRDVTEESGLAGAGRRALGAVFLDYDGDRRPDLFLSGEVDPIDSLEYLLDPHFTTGRGTVRLFRNEGERFSEVTEAASLNRPLATLRALAVDINDDSWTDLVLIGGALDPEVLLPSLILLNRQGRFEEYAWLPGLSIATPVTGGTAGDFDSDGRIEIYLPEVGLFRIEPE